MFFSQTSIFCSLETLSNARLGDRLSRGQLGSKQLATLNQGHHHIPAFPGIQARKRDFCQCLVGRDLDLDRDPLQTSHFAATKGLTAQTLAPDDAQGRSRQVKAGRGQVRSSQAVSSRVKSRQVNAGQGRSRQVKAGQVRSGQVRAGQVKAGQVRTGQVRSRQVKAGQVRSEQA